MSLWLRWLLGWGSETRSTLTVARHDASKDIGRALDIWWWRLRWSSSLRSMRGIVAWPTAGFQLSRQPSKLLLILGFDLSVCALQLHDALADNLHFLELLGD